MREITLPPAVTVSGPVAAQGGRIMTEVWSARRVLREVVLMLDWWRRDAQSDRVEAFLAIDMAVAGAGEDNLKLVLTDKQTELLSSAMQMPGTQVSPPVLNRFYMQIFSAVLGAKEVTKDPEQPAPETA